MPTQPTLPPFNAGATCPKCGHDQVRVAYVSEHRSWSSPSCGLTHEAKYVEHLDRSCQRCHYTWAEAVLEAARATEPGAGGGEG